MQGRVFVADMNHDDQQDGYAADGVKLGNSLLHFPGYAGLGRDRRSRAEAENDPLVRTRLPSMIGDRSGSS